MGERVRVKDKIKLLSKGIFEYDQPSIILSEESLQLDVEVGKILKGYFTIENNKETELKGIVYTSNSSMKIANPTFIGKINRIDYEFSSAQYVCGDVVTGFFTIVSNCGETELPFQVTIESSYCSTSMGKIKDLFQFTNLVKTEPSEAIKLFMSEDFERVFLHDDKQSVLIHRSLIKSDNPYHAMEEFLIGVNKKQPIHLSIQKNYMEYQVRKESFMDKIQITKDNWGYAQFNVYVDAAFIQIEQDVITADQFIGNSFYLEYVIDPSFMRDGINYGRITISSIVETITVEIKVICNKAAVIREEGHAKKREGLLHLLQNYLNFRTHKLEKGIYMEESKSIISILENYSHSRSLELIRTHLAMINGQEDYVIKQLDVLEQEKERLRQSSMIEYCGFHYLNALFKGDESQIKIAVDEITSCYENGYKIWQILWFLLYLDKRYENNHIKLQAIKEQLKQGCHSPIMYFEMCSIYNEEPELLIELDRETILSMNWGIKAGIINIEAANQYIFLAGREKTFHKLIFRGLVFLYYQQSSTEILFSICSMLIKGHMISNKYFKWYELGVKEQLRLTELHEHFMYSLDEKEEIELPHAILLYFVYNSTLTDKKKSFLYAYIIKHRNLIQPIYHTYRKQMEGFALKQLAAHNISNHLAVMYNEFLTELKLDEHIARNIPYVLYQHEIQCHNSNIIGVYIVHKEMNEEEFVTLEDGCAYASIYTEHAKLFFVDNNNNRYYKTIPYDLNRILSMNELEQTCSEIHQDNKMLLLSMFDKIQNYQYFNHHTITIKRRVFDIPNLTKEYKRESYMALVQFYYDNFEEVSLEELLMKAGLVPLTYSDSQKIIEYCIIRDLYESANYYIQIWGFEQVPINRLFKFCKRMIINRMDKHDQGLILLAYHLLIDKKVDDITVSYLVKHFVGTTKEMYEVWKTAKGMEIACEELEERLLAQMLFTEHQMLSAETVFLSYYQHANNPLLVRAFLSYLAYKYVLKDRQLNTEFFELFRKETCLEENEILLIAILKYYCEKECLTNEEKEFADFSLHMFIEKGLILPFFQQLKEIIAVPYGILRQYFVEYKCNPQKNVRIHYCIEDENGDDEYITEIMPNVYKGIHVKGFLLFYNQVIQYYITEEMDGQEIITESSNIKMEMKYEDKSDSKYSLINLILMAKEMKDEKTMIELMKQFIKMDCAQNQLFTPL